MFVSRFYDLVPRSICLRRASRLLLYICVVCDRRGSVCFRHISVTCLSRPLCICAAFYLSAPCLWAFAPTTSFVCLRRALGALLPPSIYSGCWLLGISLRSLSSPATDYFFLYARTVVLDFLSTFLLNRISSASGARHSGLLQVFSRKSSISVKM